MRGVEQSLRLRVLGSLLRFIGGFFGSPLLLCGFALRALFGRLTVTLGRCGHG